MLTRRGCCRCCWRRCWRWARSAGWSRGWYAAGPLAKDTPFIVDGWCRACGAVAAKLEAGRRDRIGPALPLRARMFGGGLADQGGRIPAAQGGQPVARSSSIIQGDEVLRRFVTIPEGMPSIMVQERLMAQPRLTGDDRRSARRLGAARYLRFRTRREPRGGAAADAGGDAAHAGRTVGQARAGDRRSSTPQEALSLASIVEKETGKPSERADGRRALFQPAAAGDHAPGRSDDHLSDHQGQAARPAHPPVGNPGGQRLQHLFDAGAAQGPDHQSGARNRSPRCSTRPATDALYMVADGTGGHVFAATLEEHNANVEKWFAIRRARGEI